MEGLNQPLAQWLYSIKGAYTRDVINMNVEQRGLCSFAGGQNIWIWNGAIWRVNWHSGCFMKFCNCDAVMNFVYGFCVVFFFSFTMCFACGSLGKLVLIHCVLQFKSAQLKYIYILSLGTLRRDLFCYQNQTHCK